MKKTRVSKTKKNVRIHRTPKNIIQINNSNLFPIVGIGASAGGLETFTQLFKELPIDTGMAFVLIQHLDPTHSSFLSEALSKTTKMPVHEITDGLKTHPNNVYVIPSGSDIGILHGKFTLFPRDKNLRKLNMAIDFFFHALAADCGSRAIGVILSGTATDGTNGLRVIKAENGVTFAQDPKTAKYSGMPQSAVNADVVDFCMPISKIAQELVRLAQHPYISGRLAVSLSQSKDSLDLQKIFILLRSTAGVDFSEYKTPTIKRRLARRMALLKISSLTNYINYLQDTPEEGKAMTRDILIHVTSFFRDPEVFKKLKATIYPEIIKNKSSGTPIRVWVTGCSSGEEVYSIAISLIEYLGERISKFPIQVFGSDISEQMIIRARAAFYPESALDDIDPIRLQSFFIKVEGGYQISKRVRDLCVFVRHDLAKDPPFSKLDLITCRNVLIYFETILQKRIIATFHYCLNKPGFLLLGATESVSPHNYLFSVMDKENKIFSREAVTSQLKFITMQNTATRKQAFQPILIEPGGRHIIDVAKQIDNVLLSQYAPAGVVVNEQMDVLQFRGQTGRYLEPPPGQPQLSVLKMVRESLFAPLKIALGEAKRKMTIVRKEGLHFRQNGTAQLCNLVVIPVVKLSESKEPLFLVLFEELPVPIQKKKRHKDTKDTKHSETLSIELRSTQEYLQSLNEEHQKTNDILNSANEELVSSNEELQSLNEELETAKEELQSTNEELTTVNDELQNRNYETALINDDLTNLLNSVEIPIIILDLNRRVRRFTTKARSMMNLVPTDVGRSIDDIKLNIKIENLNSQIQEVIDTVTIKESEVQDHEGQWHRLQIRPYKTIDNRIAGTVLSLVNINKLRELIQEANLARGVADKANMTKDLFLATLSHELRTPLTSLILRAQMLRRGPIDEDKVQKASMAIEKAGLAQSQLIEDLLDVSRIVTGKIILKLEATDLEKVVLAALDTVSDMVKTKSIKVDSDLSPDIGFVYGDFLRLQQVILNLLTNAIKFTPKGAKVSVTLKSVGGFGQIQVTDTGVGISNDFLPHVFSRFSQAEGTIVRTHGGLGIGLAIANHLVGMHGGSIRAESKGVGKGATFTVLLPLAKEVLEETSIKKSRVKGSSALIAQKGDGIKLSGLRILVVEDDGETRAALTEILGMAGAEVQAAESAKAAMKVLKEYTPDLMILDVAMPEEDGYSLLRRIRKLVPVGEKIIPAIALTALASDKDRKDAMAAGFQMHLTKPIDIDRLTSGLLSLKGKDLKAIHQG